MPDDILAALELAPADVPALPAKARNALIAYLLRWEHHDAARRCLQQLLVTHGQLAFVYDNLTHAYLGIGQPTRAVEMMQRRHALRISNSSRVLEAEALLAAGDLAAAQAIARELVSDQPHMLNGWSLQADVCLAAGDFDGAEAALQQRERLQPETAATALGLARLWLARGDPDKALLWARTALSRTERDERQPALDLLRLLESLYRATGQPAQADATAAVLHQRQQQDLDNLRQTLGLTLPIPAFPDSPVPRRHLLPRPSPNSPPTNAPAWTPLSASTFPLPIFDRARPMSLPPCCAARASWPSCPPARANRSATNWPPCCCPAPRWSSRPSSP